MPAPPDLIQKIPLFAGLERKEVEKLARSFKERTFKAGQTVAAEGQGGVGFFVIESGEASVSVRGEDRGRLKAGDHFGEIALIDDGARTATITATTELRCYGLTSWDFRPLVESDAGIAWKMLQSLAKKLRAAERSD